MTTISTIGAISFSLLIYYYFDITLAILLFIPIEVLIRKNKWFYIIYKTFPRDITIIYRYGLFHLSLWNWKRRSYTVAKTLTDLAKKHPDKPAFKMDNRSMTFKEVDLFSNRIAQYFKSLGYKRGDSVALFMESKPEFPCIWLGLSKLGIVTALINTNLRKEPLIHSIKCVKCKAIIYGSELSEAICEVKDKFDDNVKYFEFQDNIEDVNDIKSNSLNYSLTKVSDEAVVEELKQTVTTDKLIYVYTSGTTGLPKAAVITNLRFFFICAAPGYVFNIKSDDIIYDSLPLYHTAGGVIGIGQALLCGRTVVIRKKFSASNFWKDCIKHNCTIAQYIGEICRYLLVVPEKSEDQQHKVRLMMGNGLRPQIWTSFMERFGIKEICEFYGATESNANLANFDSKVGAVGFIPRYLQWFYPVILVRSDQVTGEIIRDRDGHCVLCRPNEPGILIGKIDQRKVVNQFDGYSNKKDSEKTILRNVFKKGDAYFNTGDLLVQDQFGYFYFKDRTGDTFRWRGENVATSEVEAVISQVVGLSDAAVYGVQIPNVEGKAGMVAILDPDNKVDLTVLLDGVKQKLPTYARPLFVRLLKELPMTGTYKMKKRDLQAESYNIDKVKDEIYFLNNDKYTLLTKDLYNDIINAKIRL